MATRHDALIQRLQEFRQTTAALSAEIDSLQGAGTPGRIADHLSKWSAAVIGLLSIAPLNPPTDPGGGVTTYNSGDLS